MTELIKRFERNTAGRDFAVGDIHGHFTRLQAALDSAGFDHAADRLFSVGDLVDRGPDSEDVDDWLLRKPWFHSIRGNHEQMVIERSDIHFGNGGAWFCGMSSVDKDCYASILGDLPLIIEVETESGLVGLVHADVPCHDWEVLKAMLLAGGAESEHLAAMCQWSRRRIQSGDASIIGHISAVICGHTPLRKPAVLGNVYHIDTGGWLSDGSGYFTLLNLNTLESIPKMTERLDWNS